MLPCHLPVLPCHLPVLACRRRRCAATGSSGGLFCNAPPVSPGPRHPPQINVTANGMWYDLSVTFAKGVDCPADATFSRRFMGHMETGAVTTSDPAMAAGVPGISGPSDVSGQQGRARALRGRQWCVLLSVAGCMALRFFRLFSDAPSHPPPFVRYIRACSWWNGGFVCQSRARMFSQRCVCG
jgi:hypothetical protein